MNALFESIEFYLLLSIFLEKPGFWLPDATQASLIAQCLACKNGANFPPVMFGVTFSILFYVIVRAGLQTMTSEPESRGKVTKHSCSGGSGWAGKGGSVESGRAKQQLPAGCLDYFCIDKTVAAACLSFTFGMRFELKSSSCEN